MLARGKGFVYTAFVTNVYSRRIVEWALSDSMRTDALPLQALNQAAQVHKGNSRLGLSFGSRLAVREHSIREHRLQRTASQARDHSSTGTIGDFYDNAMAENLNGSYNSELIDSRR